MGRPTGRRVRAGAVALAGGLVAVACSGGDGGSGTLAPRAPVTAGTAAAEVSTTATIPTLPTIVSSTVPATVSSTLPATVSSTIASDAGSTVPEPDGNEIVVDLGVQVGRFDRRLLGTNVPAWLGPERLADPAWVQRTVALGTTMLRFPGGSWSGAYDWLGCENDESSCEWPWASRPTDVATFLRQTGTEAMWTVSFNGTAQEAAALVAFFNGSVDDTTPIGTDRNGRDWNTVGEWASLRAEHGNPDPVRIGYWEVGNEIYGAKAEAKGDCADWGWEDTWTCEGTDYVNGDEQHDGYLAFREAMLAVDPDIQIGAVGVPQQGSWGDWGNEVIGGAADAIDFYIVHHYGFSDQPNAEEALAVPLEAWAGIVSDVRAAFDERSVTGVPIAVTEYNMAAFLGLDTEQLMTTATDAFYIAETIGQFALNGVTMANQWNLANGRDANGSDYGLVDAETLAPYPSYYALALWSRFAGSDLVAIESDLPLSLYAGRNAEGGVEIFAINTTDQPVDATLRIGPDFGPASVTADVVEVTALDSSRVTFNGAADPSADLSEPAIDLGRAEGAIEHAFPPMSMTVLHATPE